jgi:hypothetical protein
MKRGILFAIPGALACCALTQACRTPADPGQLLAVDDLITRTDAALLTLNELDTAHYAGAEAFHAAHAGTLDSLLHDTLDDAHAELLVNAAIVMRHVPHMADDHRRVAADLQAAAQRLRALRTDLERGAIPPDEGAPLVERERAMAVVRDTATHRLLDNNRILQGLTARFPQLDSLLLHTPGRP